MGNKKNRDDPVSGSPKQNLPIDDDQYSSASISDLVVPVEHAPKSVETGECSTGTVESAAAKKNRKKKEKERAKKASILEEKAEESKTDTKIPKHVRDIQVKIARRKEAEENKVREEEARLRKEEEEKRQQEKLKRLAEEKKRVKKEKEKQKTLQKKLEGKPVTRKQKEAQRKLEAHRKQIEENKVRSDASRLFQPRKLPQAATDVETKEPEGLL